MLDINLIREQPDLVRKALRDRQMDAAPVDAILKSDARRRDMLTEVEALKAERNTVSREIGQMKDSASRLTKIEAMRAVGDKIAALDKEVIVVEQELKSMTAAIPNVPDGDKDWPAQPAKRSCPNNGRRPPTRSPAEAALGTRQSQPLPAFPFPSRM